MGDEKSTILSRRKFLRNAGATVAGLALVGSGLLLSGCEELESVASEMPKIPAAQLPFKYTKLDPDEAARRAYEGYKAGG